MATEGFIGFYLETRDYNATAAFWKSLGFRATFETDHASGQWQHPSGGPYVFIAEQLEQPLEARPILGVADSTAFMPHPSPTYVRAFEAQHWNVVEALLADPDGRSVSLQAPLPTGTTVLDADAHHADKYH